MKISFLTRVARGYLFFISIYYFLIGIGTYFSQQGSGEYSGPFSPILSILTDVGSVFAIGSPFIGIIPLNIFSTDYILHGIDDPSLPYLSMAAIFFGIISFITLILVEKSAKFMIVWYGLSGLACLMVIYNIVYVIKTEGFVYIFSPFIFLNLMNFSLLFLATRHVYRVFSQPLPRKN